ncbi:ribosomal RNA large subunit methyltransferase F-like protein [Globomyces pollinis-pini]|nr:ribosomal RNA large subunit methyltransferase F-like protein [Globomyces pollinis-pini]
MHQRNPYSTPFDYNDLAEAFPPLKHHLTYTKNGPRILDFKDPKVLRDLNCAILWRDFKVRLEIPLDSLIPPIPNRLDYILHIEDLLANSKHKKEIHGIDIGIGASCIYPILGCKTNSNWNFLGLEVDERNLEFAEDNIKRNKLNENDRIILKQNFSKKRLLPKKLLSRKYYDFCMCNPPFYRDQNQIAEQKALKISEPYSICTGSKNEMITDGGEVQFIKQLIHESTKRRKRIGWFTTLIGRRADAIELESHLNNLNSTYNLTVKLDSYRQSYTTRWILSWTFDERLHGQEDPVKKKLKSE